MKIILPADFLSTVKTKHLLLDSSIFIDASIHPSEFTELVNVLKVNDVTLVTIKPVIVEFLKGAADKTRANEKLKIVNDIIETSLPITDNILDLSLELTSKYGVEGKSLSVTDILLGAFLLFYNENLLLVTKNTTDFPDNIFKVETFFNLIHRKGIQSYGLYTIRKPH